MKIGHLVQEVSDQGHVRGPGFDDEAPLFHYLEDGCGYVCVFTTEQLICSLNDRHFTAKSPKHLPKLKTYVTASEHQQMLRQFLEFHD